MSPKKVITVFGATGAQGGAVVDTFLSDPKLTNDWQVRGVTRDTTKDSSKKLADRGVEVVSADMNDKASLQKAMEGSATVFAVTNYWEKMDADLELQQGKNLADAAKAAGVEHYIWSSLVNVKKLTNGKLSNVHHFDAKAKVEDYVRELGIPATFFMPGMYITFFFGGGSFRQNSPSDPWTLSLPGPIDAKLPLFYPPDGGKWVKAIVLKRSELLGKNVRVATEYYTPGQLVEGFTKTFPEAGKGATYNELPHEVFVNILKSTGMPEFGAVELLENMRLTYEGGYYGGAPLSHEILYPEDKDKLTTWSDYLKKHSPVKDLK